MQSFSSKILLIILIILIGLFAFKTFRAPSTISEAVNVIVSETSPLASKETSDQFNEKIHAIIHDYLMNNPDVIIQAVEQFQKRKMQEVENKVNGFIKDNKTEIENSPSSPTLGKTDGDIIVTCFYDYNCGYCKKGDIYITQLLESDSNVKVILKPFPILGDSSIYAAKVALAAYKIAPEKFNTIHNGLMDMKPISKESVEKLLADNGFDLSKVEDEMDSKDLQATIANNIKLAQNLKIQGVPAYVINGKLIPGMVDFDQLKKVIIDIRAEK